MATTVAASRRRQANVLTYPGGFSHAAHGCDGCLGKGGDCTAATKASRDVVEFELADGRRGVVAVAVGADALTTQAAITAWATANPVAADPLAGQVV